MSFIRYEELREKTQTSPFLGDQAISDMLTKLQVFAHMDNKTVPYAKVRLIHQLFKHIHVQFM